MSANETLTKENATKKLKQGMRWLTLSAVLAIASLGGWWLYSRTLKQSSNVVEVRLITVKTDTLEEPINESGILEIGDQRILKSPDNGIVEKVLVKMGDRIAIGDELILLRSPDRETKLLEHQYNTQEKELALVQQRQKIQDAEAELALKQEKLQDLLTEYRSNSETQRQQKQLEIQNQQLSIQNQRQVVILAQENFKQANEKLQQFIKEQSSDIQTQIRQKKLDIQKQQLNLENLAEKVREAELNVTESQEQMQQAEDLYERGFIAENELQRDRQEVRSNLAILRDAQLTLTTFQIDLNNSQLDLQNLEKKLSEELVTLQMNVKEKQSNLETANIQIKNQENTLNSLSISAQKIEQELEDTVSNAREEVAQAEIKLRDAKLDLSNSIIALDKHQLERQKIEQEIIARIVTAPISGKVLNIAVEPGDVVDRSKELLIIGDPNREVVKLQISTLNAAKVKPNQLARISLAGPDEEIFTGYVETVSLVANSGSSQSSGSSSSSGNATVAATVRLDSPSGSFIPGSRVSVDIILEQRENVIAVETSVVDNSGSEPFVWVRNAEGKAQKKSVKLGLEDLTNGLVEVTSGLEAGDEVILPPVDRELTEGTIVKEFKPENTNQPSENSRPASRPTRRGRRRN